MGNRQASAAPWNTLEVAKLGTSALTPLLVAVLGWYITSVNAENEQLRRNHERSRDLAQAQRQKALERSEDLSRRAAEKAEARQQARREQAYAAALKASDLRREEALRAETIRREDALRNDAIVRDAAVRRESVEVARLSKLIEKRAELWEKLGPKLTFLHRQFERTKATEIDLTRVMAEIQDIDDLALTYEVYFSEKLIGSMKTYARSARILAIHVRLFRKQYGEKFVGPLIRADPIARVIGIDAERRYARLRALLAADLAIVREARPGPSPALYSARPASGAQAAAGPGDGETGDEVDEPPE